MDSTLPLPFLVPEAAGLAVLKVYFDGGCAPTNPGNCYGSFEIWDGIRLLSRAGRVKYGWGTNNEAEWQALQQALDVAVELEPFPGACRLDIFTDSTIVRSRLVGRNRIFKRHQESSRRMFERAEAALKVLRRFAGFTVTWQPRQRNVERFGH